MFSDDMNKLNKIMLHIDISIYLAFISYLRDKTIF